MRHIGTAQRFDPCQQRNITGSALLTRAQLGSTSVLSIFGMSLFVPRPRCLLRLLNQPLATIPDPENCCYYWRYYYLPANVHCVVGHCVQRPRMYATASSHLQQQVPDTLCKDRLKLHQEKPTHLAHRPAAAHRQNNNPHKNLLAQHISQLACYLGQQIHYIHRFGVLPKCLDIHNGVIDGHGTPVPRGL